MKQNQKINTTNSDCILINAPNKDVVKFIKTKVYSFQEIIKKTILAVNKYKYLDILGTNDINICIKSLESLFSQLVTIENTTNIDKMSTISKY